MKARNVINRVIHITLVLLTIPECHASVNREEEEINASCSSSSSFACSSHEIQQQHYGVDVSWPMQNIVSNNNNKDNDNGINVLQEEKEDNTILGNQHQYEIYKEYMKGCHEHYYKKEQQHNVNICNNSEKERIEMNIRQPQSMKNYTKLGYKIIKTPSKLFSIIYNFWDSNKHNNYALEQWSTESGHTYTNHWKSPSYIVNINNSNLMNDKILKSVEEILKDWIGVSHEHELEISSIYGIRIYTDGAILASHVDRLPLVISAIINVDQDVEEPWPLEVIGHDGIATNITMKPGDMILYESHSIIHGRPFPLSGRFFANLFIHFAPIAKSNYTNINNDDVNTRDDRFDITMPSYIIKDSPEYQRQINIIKHQQQQHQNKNNIINFSSNTKEEKHLTKQQEQVTPTIGTTLAHKAAEEGIIPILQSILNDDENKIMLNQRDENGWTPFNEAARNGQIDAMIFLVDHCDNISSCATIEELIEQKTNAGDNSFDIVNKFYNGMDKEDIVLFLKQTLLSIKERNK